VGTLTIIQGGEEMAKPYVEKADDKDAAKFVEKHVRGPDASGGYFTKDKDRSVQVIGFGKARKEYKEKTYVTDKTGKKVEM
jgi:hypothetical protein